MSTYLRLVPRVRVQTDRGLGSSQAATTTRTFFNFSHQTVYFTDLAGFRRPVLAEPPPTKELAGKIIIEDRYHMRESTFEENKLLSIQRDPHVVGPFGQDALTTFRESNPPRCIDTIRTLEYLVEFTALSADKPTVLENLGLTLQIDPTSIQPHPDNSFVVNSYASDDGVDEPNDAISMYLKMRLIDPSLKVGDIFVNAHGQALPVRPTRVNEHRIPEGLYITTHTLDRRGRSAEHTEKVDLEHLVESNGYYRNQRDALDLGSQDIAKRRLDQTLIDSKRRYAEQDLEVKRLELVQRRLEMREKREAERTRAIQQQVQTLQEVQEQLLKFDRGSREELSNTLRWVAETTKNVALLLAGAGGLLKLFSSS